MLKTQNSAYNRRKGNAHGNVFLCDFTEKPQRSHDFPPENAFLIKFHPFCSAFRKNSIKMASAPKTLQSRIYSFLFTAAVFLFALALTPGKLWDFTAHSAKKRSDVIDMPIDAEVSKIQSEDVVLVALPLSPEDPASLDPSQETDPASAYSSDPANGSAVSSEPAYSADSTFPQTKDGASSEMSADPSAYPPEYAPENDTYPAAPNAFPEASPETPNRMPEVSQDGADAQVPENVLPDGPNQVPQQNETPETPDDPQSENIPMGGYPKSPYF